MLTTDGYPLNFIWKSDYWSTLKNILQNAAGRRCAAGIIDDAKDFRLDHLGDALEPIARQLSPARHNGTKLFRSFYLPALKKALNRLRRAFQPLRTTMVEK
jgi:hypothetical protein